MSRNMGPFTIVQHATRIREVISALEWYCAAKKKDRKLVEGMTEMFPFIVGTYKMHMESKKTEKQKSIWIA